VSIPPCGRGIFKASGSTDPMWSLEERRGGSFCAPFIVSMSPTGLSLAWLRSRSAAFRFARQSHCSAAATSAANFRMARIYGIRVQSTLFEKGLLSDDSNG
jgi:hypothetical protein